MQSNSVSYSTELVWMHILWCWVAGVVMLVLAVLGRVVLKRVVLCCAVLVVDFVLLDRNRTLRIGMPNTYLDVCGG